MGKLSKKAKGWLVFSIIWFLATTVFAFSQVTDVFAFSQATDYPSRVFGDKEKEEMPAWFQFAIENFEAEKRVEAIKDESRARFQEAIWTSAIVAEFLLIVSFLNAPLLIGWPIWCGLNLSVSGKAVRVLSIVTVIWFLITIWYIDWQEGLNDFGDFIQEIPIFLILNSPLIIGWGTRWISKGS